MASASGLGSASEYEVKIQKLKAGNLVDDSGERTAESVVVLLAVPPSADLRSVSAQDAFSSSLVHRALDLRNASIVLFQVWM